MHCSFSYGQLLSPSTGAASRSLLPLVRLGPSKVWAAADKRPAVQAEGAEARRPWGESHFVSVLSSRLRRSVGLPPDKPADPGPPVHVQAVLEAGRQGARQEAFQEGQLPG